MISTKWGVKMGRWVLGYVLWGATIAAVSAPFLPIVMDAVKAVVSIIVLFVAFDRGAADSILQGDSTLLQNVIIAGLMAALFMMVLLVPLVIFDRLVALLRLDGLFAYLLFGAAATFGLVTLAIHGPIVPSADQFAEVAPMAAVMAVPVLAGAFVFWLVAVTGRSRG